MNPLFLSSRQGSPTQHHLPAPLPFGFNGVMIFTGQGAGALFGGLVTETIGVAATGLVGASVAIIAIAVTLATVRSDPILVPTLPEVSR